MKYNFSQTILKDLEGKTIEGHDAHKALAQGLYVGTKDLDLVTKAIEINQGKEVELDKVEVEKVKEFINGDQCTLVAFAKKAVLDYIESIKSE